MRPNEQHDVASLIRESTNSWYEANGKAPIFTGDPSATMLFCDVYEALDPGCCLVAVVKETGQIAASCFYHPRSTHVSLGIMNVHPNHFGKVWQGIFLTVLFTCLKNRTSQRGLFRVP